MKKQFASLDDFLRRWTDAEQKKAIIDELAAQGVMWEALDEEVQAKRGQPLDPFDLICHIAFDQPPLTRKERAEQVKNATTSPNTPAPPARCWRPCWTSTPTPASSTSKT